MTIDKSLKRKGTLARSRNVLKRHERIAILKGEDRFEEGKSNPLGLPKVRIVKSTVGKKKKEKKAEEEPAKKK